MGIFDKIDERRRTGTISAPPSAKAKLKKLSESKPARDPVAKEIDRIVQLQIWTPPTPEEREAFERENILVDAYDRGFRLFPAQISALMSYDLLGGGFFPIGVGWGKCVSAETEFYDLRLGRRRADEAGPSRTPSMSSDGKILARDATVFPSGEKPCVELKLCSGQRVTLSEDHPVFSERGWINAADLAPGELAATPRQLPEPEQPAVVEDSVVVFAAYMMADGCVSGGQPSFTNMDPDVWEELTTTVEALGGTLGSYKGAGQAWTYSIRGMGPLLRSLGLWGHKSTSKRLPAGWYCLPSDQCALFLSRFIACDGYVDARTPAFEITLANEGLIRDIQHLLLRLGVCASIYLKRSHGFKAWRLFVTGNDARLLAHILPLIPGKQQSQQKVAADRRKFNTNTDVVPFGREELSSLCDEKGIPGRGGCPSTRSNDGGRSEMREFLGATAGQRVSRDKFQQFAKTYGAGRYEWLAHSDLRWSKVKSVEPKGVLPVYDLNVPGTESWIGNGIVLHNTLISLMIAERAYRTNFVRASLLLVPPQVYPQLVERDIPWARRRVPISVPFHKLGRATMRKRLAIARSKAPGCYILPYSLLSTEDSERLLELIEPQLIIADEAHLLKNARTARTRRVRRYLDKIQPQLVAMSGTITSKSITDYWHIIKACLGQHCPLPLSSHLVLQWARVLDAQQGSSWDQWRSGVDQVDGFATEPIMPLVRWAQKHWPVEEFPDSVRGFRKAYKLRLTTAPGVISTGDAEIGTSLVMRNEPVKPKQEPTGWRDLQELIDRVRQEWIAPNGDEIDHAIHSFGWLYQLSAGFYNDLYWPSAQVLAGERGIRESEAAELLDRAQHHHQLLQLYHSALRKWLNLRSRPGLDTPFLVAADMERNGAKNVGQDLYAAWEDVREADFEDRPERRSRPVRVCDYKVRAAVQWAQKLPAGTGAILWVHHQEIGKWVAERLRKASLDVLHCPAGRQHDTSIIDPANERKLVVASITAHGTGKNLQHFEHQYVVQWPRSAVVAEQMLGRTHRTGQQADELVVVSNNTGDIDQLNFAACLNDAAYIHQTTGVRQKLMFATFETPPVMFDYATLRKAGLDPKRLTGEQIDLLKERFGATQA